MADEKEQQPVQSENDKVVVSLINIANSVTPKHLLDLPNDFTRFYLQLWLDGKITYEHALASSVVALHRQVINLLAVVKEHEMKFSGIKEAEIVEKIAPVLITADEVK